MAAVAEYRELPVDELKAREAELREEIFRLRMKLATDAGALGTYRTARKDLARVLTLIKEKSMTEGTKR